MTTGTPCRMLFAATAAVMALAPVTVAAAAAQPPSWSEGNQADYGQAAGQPGYGAPDQAGQSYGDEGYDARPSSPPPPGSGQPYGYGREAPPSTGYGSPPPTGYASPPLTGYGAPPPPGYDGTRPPPPPPGYVAGADAARQQEEDRRYAQYADGWAQENCVKAHGNAGAGAVIGGAIGALLGSGLSGRGGHAAGALIGAGVGGAGGAAIAGSQADATSPGCPPGYVVREGAPAFAYAGGPYAYAAPEWYRPWVYVGGVWSYRPYPYHVWYYQHYHGGWRPAPRPYREYRRHW